MAPDLYVEVVPASVYDLTTCTTAQLDQLECQAKEVVDRIRDTKKGCSVIKTLITRRCNLQSVRCTSQSVRATACARYEPTESEFDLSSLSIVCFIGVVTYLPLPLIKSLVGNKGVTAWVERVWEDAIPDIRWTMYHACLASVNPAWATLLLREVQLHTGGPIIHQVHADDTSIATQSIQCRPGYYSMTDENITQPEPLRNEALLLRVVKAKTSAWGSDHPTTIDSIVHLASLYVGQSRLAEARSLLLEAFRGWKSTQTKQTQEVFSLLVLLGEVDCQLELTQRAEAASLIAGGRR